MKFLSTTQSLVIVAEVALLTTTTLHVAGVGATEPPQDDVEECFPGTVLQEDGTCNIPELHSGAYKVLDEFMDGIDFEKGKGPRCQSFGGLVERIPWPVGDQFAEELAKRNRPVVLTGTVSLVVCVFFFFSNPL
jgi:hypothetical protein